MENRLTTLRRQHPAIERIAGEGLSWNIELHGPNDLRPESWHGEGVTVTPASLVIDAALKRGLLVRAKGALGFWIFPPLIVTEAELDAALDVLGECLELIDDKG